MIEDEKIYNIKEVMSITGESYGGLRNKIREGILKINSDKGKKIKVSGKNLKDYLKL